MKVLVRFDDISLNTDGAKLRQMIAFLREKFAAASNLRIIFAVCPTAHRIDASDSELEHERPYPALFNPESDYRMFYRPQLVGVPSVVEEMRDSVELAGHGMVHVDHRLLPRSVQELSILMSCSLLRCSVFVPPFHKFNQDTVSVCQEHDIALIRYDASWRHLAYHPFDPQHEKYYVHTHDLSLAAFCARFSQPAH